MGEYFWQPLCVENQFLLENESIYYIIKNTSHDSRRFQLLKSQIGYRVLENGESNSRLKLVGNEEIGSKFGLAQTILIDFSLPRVDFKMSFLPLSSYKKSACEIPPEEKSIIFFAITWKN